MIPNENLEESKPIASLDNWYVTYGEWDGYTAPEDITVHIIGEVYNHALERHYDGKKVRISPVKGNPVEFSTVETKRTIYLLGGMKPEYKKWCEANGHL